MTDFFSTPDDLGDVRQSELQSSLGEQLGARALDAVDPSTWLSGAGIYRAFRQGAAGGFAAHDYDGLPGQAGFDLAQMDKAAREAIPDVSIADARARVKQEGLEGHMHLPDATAIKAPVLDLMVNEAHERRDREAAIARGPQGFLPGALGLVTSLGAGMVDPVNAAAFSVPVLGEARWGKLLASAGDSILARTGARALQGGAQGAVGTALLQPADWWLHTRDGQDYTFADALKSVAMGAGMGAGFHAGFGGIGDVYSRLRGRPLRGSPQEQLEGALQAGQTAPPEAAPGMTADQVAGSIEDLLRASPAHPAEVLADLPPAAREDIAHAAAADVIADRPVRGAEILSIAASHDARIAESVNMEAPTARDAVFDDVHQKLRALGMDDDEAATNAAIVAARYATRAERLGGAGGTAADLYAGEGLEIRKGEFALPQIGRSFDQVAQVDGVRIDFPDHDHIALYELGRKLAKREKVDETEVRRLYDRFKGWMIEEPDYPLRNTKDLKDAARDYHDEVAEHVRRGRPNVASSLIDTDKQADWFRRALEERTAREPARVIGGNGQLTLFQRRPKASLLEQREADGQMTLPGAERIGQGEQAQRGANEPLKAAREQKPLDFGLFSDDAKQRSLFQDGEEPRGRITLSEGEAIIDLFKTADQSTFMHESGHLWLDELMRDAEHPNAPQQLTRDRDTVLRWLGVDKPGDIGVEQHEKWARGFEQYLASGKAPSSALAKAFDAFKQWLTEIYRAIGGLPEISPEVRGVMDRLLATDSEIGNRPRAEASRATAARPAAVDPDLVSKPKARGRAAADPATWSLFEHLASKGGLKPDPELAAIFGNKRGPFVPGFGPLIRRTGMTLDEALRSAKDHGYMFDAHDEENGTAGTSGRNSLGLTPRDLLDHIDSENRGRKLYKAGHIEATKYNAEAELHIVRSHVESEFEAAGLKPEDIDPSLLERTTEIVHREGVTDVMDAYERAIMEDEERYNAIADARQAHPVTRDIPGFDDGRAAPGDGRRDPLLDRPAGRPEPGRGRADDPQSSSHGARAAAAAADPRWRDLADVKPAYDDPLTVSESRAADAEPEPASVSSVKSLSAIEKAAADAEEAWRGMEAAYTEEERRVVNDALDKLALDREAREQIIKDGAACLMAAGEG